MVKEFVVPFSTSFLSREKPLQFLKKKVTLPSLGADNHFLSSANAPGIEFS
jgi:hypothetical protein